MPDLSKKKDPVAAQLFALHAISGTPRTPEGLASLRRGLDDKSNFVVAAAAKIIADAELTELAPLLPPAFQRFLDAPAKLDKTCKAKIALADAMYRTNCQQEELFRRGLRVVQLEPVWGAHEDSAAELRGLCAMALAQLSPPGVLEDLAELLADPEPNARALCARALSVTGQEGALALLRYKLRLGDVSGEVLLECCSSLLSLSPKRALPLLKEMLEQGDEDRRQAAALALGQSRREEALPLLKDYAERLPESERRVPLLSIAMLRSPAATSYLMDLIVKESPALATLAVRALAVHRYDDALRLRVREVVKERGDSALLHAADEAFA